jgi:glycopeptide antibiotics resistance protein
VLGAAAALVLAAVIGAVLVFQPDAATSSGALQRLSRMLSDLGLPYERTAQVVELMLNVALFVPGAFAAALLWPRVRWWQWVLLGLAVSVGIETVQAVFLPDRDAQVRDLVSNSLGAALGAGVPITLRRKQHRQGS